jgi:hypothetical protein
MFDFDGKLKKMMPYVFNIKSTSFKLNRITALLTPTTSSRLARVVTHGSQIYVVDANCDAVGKTFI